MWSLPGSSAPHRCNHRSVWRAVSSAASKRASCVGSRMAAEPHDVVGIA